MWSISLKPRYVIGGKREPIIDDYYEPVKDYINHSVLQDEISKYESKAADHANGP